MTQETPTITPGMRVAYCRRLLGQQNQRDAVPEDRRHQEWLPMMVTHVNEDGTLDGVLFTAWPMRTGMRPNVAQVRGARQGDDVGQWMGPLEPAPGEPVEGLTVEAVIEAAKPAIEALVDAKVAEALAAAKEAEPEPEDTGTGDAGAGDAGKDAEQPPAKE